MDLGILNTVIALVIILLVLSLLVQAIQTLVKKLLKLKSHQIEGSLMDLYDQAIASTTPATSSSPSAPGVLSKLSSLIKQKPVVPDAPAELFKQKVLDQFKNIGRKTMFGSAVLDSLSKEDLFKVIGKLESEDFFPDYVTKFLTGDSRPWTIEEIENAAAVAPRDQPNSSNSGTRKTGNEKKSPNVTASVTQIAPSTIQRREPSRSGGGADGGAGDGSVTSGASRARRLPRALTLAPARPHHRSGRRRAPAHRELGHRAPAHRERIPSHARHRSSRRASAPRRARRLRV